MKKKVIISTIMASVFLVSACGLAGCKKKSPTEQEVDPEQEVIDDPAKVTGDTDASKITSDKISETEFSAVFSKSEFDSVTMKSTMQITYVYGANTSTINSTSCCYNDGDKLFVVDEGVSHGEAYRDESYLCKKEDSYYTYPVGPNGEKYEMKDDSAHAEETYNSNKVSEAVAMYSKSIKYSDLSYDDTQKAYKASVTIAHEGEEEADESSNYDFLLKFLKGKIVWSSITTSMEDEQKTVTTKINSLFYDYGTTTVTIDNVLPGYDCVNGQQVNETVWKAAFSEAEKVSWVSEGYGSVSWGVADGKKLLVVEGDKKIYEEIDDVWYEYLESDGIVSRNETSYDPSHFNNRHRQAQEGCAECFADFSYDTEKHAYVNEDGVEVKIAEGKVSWILEDGNYTHFYAYATAEVHAPTLTQSDDWTDYDVTNFKATSSSTTLHFDGDKTFCEGYNHIYYDFSPAVAGEGNVRIYEESDGKFYYRDESADMYCTFKASRFQMNASDFEKKDGVYVGKEGTDCEGRKVYFKDGKLFAVVEDGVVTKFSDFGAVSFTVPTAERSDGWGSTDISNCTMSDYQNGFTMTYAGKLVQYFSEERGEYGDNGYVVTAEAERIIVDWSEYTGEYDAAKDANGFGKITMWTNGTKTEITSVGENYESAMRYLPAEQIYGVTDETLFEYDSESGKWCGKAGTKTEGVNVTFRNGLIEKIETPDPNVSGRELYFSVYNHGNSEIEIPQN